MKKVVVIGPESTGKSTLTEALALHFNCPYRKEYAREYIAQLSGPYSPKDILGRYLSLITFASSLICSPTNVD